MPHMFQADWVQPILDDLALFLQANNMPQSVTAIRAAAQTIRSEQCFAPVQDAPCVEVEPEPSNVIPLRPPSHPGMQPKAQ